MTYLCTTKTKRIKKMNKEEILSAVRALGCSQGIYSRLYEKLTNGSEESKELMELMVKQNFKDSLDLVLWYEQ